MTITYVAAAEIARTAIKNLAKALIDDNLPYEARSMVLTLENIQDLLAEARRKLDEKVSPLRVPFGVDPVNITAAAPPAAVVASNSGHFAAGAMHAGDLDVDYPSRTGASGGSGYQGLSGFPDGD